MATTTRTRRSAETAAAAEAVAQNPSAQRPAARKAPASKTAAAKTPAAVKAAPVVPDEKPAAKKAAAKKAAAPSAAAGKQAAGAAKPPAAAPEKAPAKASAKAASKLAQPVPAKSPARAAAPAPKTAKKPAAKKTAASAAKPATVVAEPVAAGKKPAGKSPGKSTAKPPAATEAAAPTVAAKPVRKPAAKKPATPDGAGQPAAKKPAAAKKSARKPAPESVAAPVPAPAAPAPAPVAAAPAPTVEPAASPAAPAPADQRTSNRSQRGSSRSGRSARSERAEPTAQQPARGLPPPPERRPQPAASTRGTAKTHPQTGRPQQPTPRERPAPPPPRRTPPAPAPVAPPALFAWQPPEADEVFSPIALRDLRDGSEHSLHLRSATPGDNRCSCDASRSALSGQCEHLAFVLGQLSADPETAAVLEHGWQPLHSEVYLRYGARRALRWLAGSICPEPLEQAAEALLDARGDLRLDDSAALPALLRQAEALGQELRVDETVWSHLAHQRDAGNRVQRLEQAFPEGTASAGLQQLLRLPLRPYQVEGALFAAVAGHALLADEDGLGKTVQAVAATELLIRHFGVERVLVLCSRSQQPHWQEAFQELAGRVATLAPADLTGLAALPGEAAAVHIIELASLAHEREAIAGFNAELLIVDEARDEAAGEPAVDFSALDSLVAPYGLLVARTPLEERPQDLLARVMWLDPYRLGSTARFLRQHVRRNEGGAVTGYVALDQLDDTLRHVMLRRRRDDVTAQLPESVDVPWPVPMSDSQRAAHDAAARPALPILARWQRSAYVSDADQRGLVAALRQMHAICHGAGVEPQPKLDALLGLLPELLERPDTRVVVFSARTQTTLQAGRRVGEAGFDHVVFGASEATRQRLQDSTAYRVVLCSDASNDALPPQPLKTVVIQLDPPCDPQRQQRRLQRVQGDTPARNVPVIQLIAQDSLEAALWALPAGARELVASAIDGHGGQAFLQGERLAQFMAAVATLLQGPAPR